MGDVIKAGFYILLFLPGFIFVQTRDYHVLRGEKNQLEKTLEIVLWSAALWFLACGLPFFWPLPGARTATLHSAYLALSSPVQTVPVWTSIGNRDGLEFYGLVCLWAFVSANVWGVLRRTPFVDWFVKWVTKRDWYPTVSLRFFSENVDRVVTVQTETGKYIGTLTGAPDRPDDTHILLTKVFLHPTGGKEVEKLEVTDSILLKVDEVTEISVLKRQHSVKKPSRIARFGHWAKTFLVRAWSRLRDYISHARRQFLEIADGRRKKRASSTRRLHRRGTLTVHSRQEPVREQSR